MVKGGRSSIKRHVGGQRGILHKHPYPQRWPIYISINLDWCVAQTTNSLPQTAMMSMGKLEKARSGCTKQLSPNLLQSKGSSNWGQCGQKRVEAVFPSTHFPRHQRKPCWITALMAVVFSHSPAKQLLTPTAPFWHWSGLQLSEGWCWLPLLLAQTQKTKLNVIPWN